ncbi:MAG: hypothetical protein LJE68_16380 [Rhodobacter sp.]|jgi:uncharacterized ion transporter superfamily protein YfcC|nr:hypothetical protein [Rhodobacter sp.]
MGLLRLVVFGFLALSVIYLAVWFYSRSVRREKLEKKWDAQHPDGGDIEARKAYIDQGMKDYHAGIRPKLILLIYVIPAVLVIGTLIVTNWN